MATTTNYGWTTPDDTALVKDGAAAIRTLGSSIDTTLKTQIDAQIPDSLLTTKGDLIAATGASTPARLGVGTNGQALIADSTAATGMKWDTPSAGGMTLLSTTTLSGASTSISSISGSYNSLVGYIRLFLPASDGGGMFMRFNSDSNNRYRGYGWNSSSGVSNTFSDNSINVTSANVDNGVTQSFIKFEIPDYANTSTWKTITGYAFTNHETTTTNNVYNSFNTVYNQTGAITALSFHPNSGNMTSGTVLLYGVK
jgi:hypothetical protein